MGLSILRTATTEIDKGGRQPLAVLKGRIPDKINVRLRSCPSNTYTLFQRKGDQNSWMRSPHRYPSGSNTASVQHVILRAVRVLPFPPNRWSARMSGSAKQHDRQANRHATPSITPSVASPGHAPSSPPLKSSHTILTATTRADCVTTDKILAFSIMSSSPANIAGAAYATTRLSWRSGDKKQLPEKGPVKKNEHTSRPEMKHAREARPARLALEFDGLNCFESIVPF